MDQKKETIEILKDLWRYEHSEYSEKDIRKTLDIAIKALEQESILDKIRAEIADLDNAEYEFEGYYKAVNDALQIIDKYKAESEG